jgi:hypothetical protein
VSRSPCSASKTAFGPALAFDPPGGHRLGEAFEAPSAKIGQLEQAADQPARRLADDYATRFRQRLQPRREVRRVADHRLLPCRTLADQIADHHEPGRDADPCGKSFAPRCRQQADRFNKRQPRPDRALGIVLVRLWPSEIGQHAIAHVFRDVPAPALDRLGATTLIGADHAAGVLGIESARQLRRADEVAEQHRQLASLGLARNRRSWLSGLGAGIGRTGGQGRYRF